MSNFKNFLFLTIYSLQFSRASLAVRFSWGTKKKRDWKRSDAAIALLHSSNHANAKAHHFHITALYDPWSDLSEWSLSCWSSLKTQNTRMYMMFVQIVNTLRSFCWPIEQVLQVGVLKAKLSKLRWIWSVEEKTFMQPFTNSSSFSSPSRSMSSWLNTVLAFFSAVSWNLRFIVDCLCLVDQKAWWF